MLKISPEINLILSCARTKIDPETANRIEFIIQKDIDWEYLLQVARQHRVMPLLYLNLKNLYQEKVPAEIINSLRIDYLTNAARNLLFTGKLLEILNLFKDHDILVIPLKGPVLAEFLYGDIAMRQFGDLDILVYPDDALKAKSLLIALGYRPEINLDDKQFEYFLKTEDDLTLICPESRVVVELHWELSARNASFPIYIDFFQSRLEPAVFEEKKIYNFSPEDLIVYLCIHGAKHCWESLEWICGVAELAQSNPSLNWEMVIRIARDAYCERILFLGLFLAHDLLCANLPLEILADMGDDRKIRALAQEIYNTLFQNQSKMTNNDISNRFSSFHIKLKDRYSDIIRYILRMALYPTREDFKRFSLPASLSFLYHFFRPMRLMVELVPVLFRKCSRTIRTYSPTRRKT